MLIRYLAEEPVRVSHLVATLAESLEQSPLPLSDNQRDMIRVMKAMPHEYAGRLDDWEEAVPSEEPRDPRESALLLEFLYEFGRCNLYSKFDSARALRSYGAVQWLFHKAGIPTPDVKAIDEY